VVNAGAVLILYCDGTNVIQLAGLVATINDIGDVAITAAASGQMLRFNPRETAHLQVSVDFPGSPTDHAIVAVYTTLDDASEVWDLIPMMEFLLENTTDPNRISFLVTGVYKFRVGVRRSGSTDTIASADLSLRKDGVNA
jgi:hypothetical protein